MPTVSSSNGKEYHGAAPQTLCTLNMVSAYGSFLMGLVTTGHENESEVGQCVAPLSFLMN